MKYKLINLSFLVGAMVLLTSSIENPCINNVKTPGNNKDSCSVSGKGCAIKKAGSQTPVVQKKNDNDKNLPFADYRLPVTPFSRFIL